MAARRAERRERLHPLWRSRDYARLEDHWSAALRLPYLEPRRERIELGRPAGSPTVRAVGCVDGEEEEVLGEPVAERHEVPGR